MENIKKSVFSIRNRKYICENARFNVFLDHVKGNNGQTVYDYLIVAPKLIASNMITGIAILPVLKGKFGLIKVYRHAIQDYSWEVPRGFMDEVESPISAGLRELEEETGLTCKLEDIQSLGYVTPEAGVLKARMELFVALKCREVKPYKAEEFGHKELKFFTRSKVLNMANNSIIQDPGTLITFYRLDQINSK